MTDEDVQVEMDVDSSEDSEPNEYGLVNMDIDLTEETLKPLLAMFVKNKLTYTEESVLCDGLERGDSLKDIVYDCVVNYIVVTALVEYCSTFADMDLSKVQQEPSEDVRNLIREKLNKLVYNPVLESKYDDNKAPDLT